MLGTDIDPNPCMNFLRLLFSKLHWKSADKNDYDGELEEYSEGETIMLRIIRGSSPLYIAFEIK